MARTRESKGRRRMRGSNGEEEGVVKGNMA